MKKILQTSTLRLFAALSVVLSLKAIFHSEDILTVQYAESTNTLLFVAEIAAFFAALCGIFFITKSDKVDKTATVISSLLFLTVTACTAKSVWTGTVCAVCATLLLFALCSFPGKKDILGISSIVITSAVGIFIAVFIGAITVYRYLCFYSPNYDFGIWCNMFHHMKTEFLPTVSCERDMLLSHFEVHISPIWYLILPFYCIFPSPITLQVAQAVILASGIIPLWFLARKIGFSRISSTLWCGVYALYPALSGGCCYDIHENCFLAPLLLWLFYCFEKKKTVPMYIVAFLTLCVKEDAAVYIAFLALYMFFSKRDQRNGMILFAASVIWFLAESFLMTKFGLGMMNYRYDNYFTGNGSMLNAAVNIIKDPALVLKTVFTAEKIEFILCMLVPLGFLPFFCGKKPWRLILVCPFLLVNVMTDYVYQYSIYFQYVFGSLAFLFYGTLLNVADTKKEHKNIIPTVCVCMSLIMFLSTVSSRINITETYKANCKEYETIEQVLDTVPDDASVRCSTFLLPHIADRNEIYKLESQNDTEYIVIDLRDPDSENSGKLDYSLSEDDKWKCVTRIDDIIAVWKQTNYKKVG